MVPPLAKDTLVPVDAKLPSYEPMLAAYHAAFAGELRAMVDTLPIPRGGKVVEIACGDGAYTLWLADRVGPGGTVVAVDISPDYLRVARSASTRDESAARVVHIVSPIERLPLVPGAFDLAWCAQSLFSLPEPVAALRAMADLVKPGGTVAVFETDTVHQLLLPWPVDVELAVRRAEYESFAAEGGAFERYYVGRDLAHCFGEAGLDKVLVRSFASTRQAPLSAPVRTFLVAYLADLSGRVLGRLDPTARDRFAALSDPDADTGLVNRPDLTVTCLDLLATGVKRPR